MGGSSSRDYTYIDDIVNGVVLSLDKPQGYQIYNLGNGNPVGLKDFISIVERPRARRPRSKSFLISQAMFRGQLPTSPKHGSSLATNPRSPLGMAFTDWRHGTRTDTQ